MTFQPFVPSGGLAGWRFLQSTVDAQKAAHASSPIVRRDIDYFAERIGEVRTAADLVADFRLLSVALGAFGLSDDIGNKFLIRKVLEEGTTDPEALANRLSDSRYRDFSEAFGFGDFPVPNTVLSDFPDRVASRYADQAFETALGETDETMRLALNAEREMAALAADDASDRTKWFTLMGTPPLRAVMEGALNLPPSFATLPLEKQLQVFQDRSEAEFGSATVSGLGDPATLSRILDRYTAIAGLASSGRAITSPALQILRGG